MFFNFWSSKLRIGFRIGIEPEMLDPNPESMNPDPKHCLYKQWSTENPPLYQNFHRQPARPNILQCNVKGY